LAQRDFNMKLNAQIQWTYDGTCQKMGEHLQPYKDNKIKILQALFGASEKEFEETTEICVRVGLVPKRSYFAFLKGAGNTTLIHGLCPSQRLDHLLEDFDFLIQQMENSKVYFNVREVHVRLNDEKLVKKDLRTYFLKRGVLTELFSMTGGIALVSKFFLNKPDQESFLLSVIGFIFWGIAFIIGYWSESEYVLK